MLLLDLLYYIVVLEVLIGLQLLLETVLAHSEPWLLYDQVGVLFLLFYHTSGNVTVYEVVGADWRHHLLLVHYLPLDLRLERRCHLLLSYVLLRVVGAGTW